MFKTKNNKLGFIHIPKTGGTSIELAFRELEKDNSDSGWHPVDICSAHTSYKGYKKHYDGDPPPPEQWFTLVRHPIARAHSWFHYQKEWDRRRLAGELGLKGFPEKYFRDRIEFMEEKGLKGCLFEDLVDLEDDHFLVPLHKGLLKDQYSYIKGCEEPINVFKLEELDKLYQWLYNQGCKIPILHEKKNTAKTTTWRDEFDQEMIDRALELYARDFEHFGYDLD